MASEAQIRASVKYNRTKGTISIRPDKQTAARIKAAAEALGMSVKDLVLISVDAYLESIGYTDGQTQITPEP